jgi:hypothetical protein
MSSARSTARPILGDGDVRQQQARRGHLARADREHPAVELGGIHDLIASHQDTFNPHRISLIFN